MSGTNLALVPAPEPPAGPAGLGQVQRPARALIILTPDIGAQYFRDIAEVAGAPGGPSPARMAEVMTRYGLVLAPPPPAA